MKWMWHARLKIILSFVFIIDWIVLFFVLLNFNIKIKIRIWYFNVKGTIAWSLKLLTSQKDKTLLLTFPIRS